MFVFTNLKNIYIKNVFICYIVANEFLPLWFNFLKEAASTSHTQQIKFNNH